MREPHELSENVSSSADFVRSRRRVFGVGAAKTGTHSLGGMFDGPWRAAHEMDAGRLIEHHLARERTGSDRSLHKYLLERDRERKLDVDVSQVNVYLIRDFETLFPKSLFILTVRHPIEWLRSIVDDCLRRPSPVECWARFREYRFSTGQPHPPEERALERRGLYPVEGYLRYWRDAIDRVLSVVPSDRLLIVRTPEISSRATEIAQFCGASPANVCNGVRLFVNPSRSGLLAQLDPVYLASVARRLCGTCTDFFPEKPIETAVAELSDEGASGP